MVFLTSSLRRFIPFFDRVLVKRIEAITQTKSGVLLPEKAQSQMNAQVVEVGPGLRDKTGKFLPMTVKIGDKVMIPEFGGTKVEIDDQEHFLFRESDLLGKISI
uniref:10 kDa heat shock protein, mitochondrial n=1 Tax=Myxobolus squamalis TaxID=59785 RepID=A0A6B2G5R1_MYXSQ